MKSTTVLHQYTMIEIRRFAEIEARQEGSCNKWESGKGWSAIKLREVRAQYTNNGKLIVQGKKEQSEGFARRLKEHTEQERRIEEGKYEEEISNAPYIRKMKQEHDGKLKIQENANRVEYLKMMTGLTPEEIRQREDGRERVAKKKKARATALAEKTKTRKQNMQKAIEENGRDRTKSVNQHT